MHFRKKRCLARLEGIQKELSRRESAFLEEKKPELMTEYKNILHEKELYWFQRAREKWLKEGERCTKFFIPLWSLKAQGNKSSN